MYGYIYKTTNLINGKIYIGQKKSKKRFYDNYFGSGLLINRALEKYGIENFKVEMICECNSQEELNLQERFYIRKLNSQNKSIGYNVLPGGQYIPDIMDSEEIRKAKSDGAKKFWDSLSKEERYQFCKSRKESMNSEKGRKHLREGQLGRKLPQEVKDKIANQSTDRISINNGKHSTKIKKEDLDKYLSNGWKIGELPRGPKKKEYLQYWVTNGIESKLVFEKDIETYLNKGWRRGRTMKRDKKGKFMSSTTIENIADN